MQLLSRLILPGLGSYTDFVPAPITHPGAYEASDYEAADYEVESYITESDLAAGADTDTRLTTPLVFERALPDDFDGTPGTRRVTAVLGNLPPAKLPAARGWLGQAATGELWEVESNTRVEQQSGIITEINEGPDRRTLTIEENAAAPLQALIPKRLVRDLFPSADFSGLSTGGDPTVIIPWGTMYKVPLPLVQRPYLHVEFQMVASENSYYYLDLVDVPDYLIQPGDRLQYDIHDPLGGSQIALDLLTNMGMALRETGAVDQNGILAHPAANLDSVALSRWYRRDIDISALRTHVITGYLIGCECNTTRGCVAYIANARIVNAQGELRLTILNEASSGGLIEVMNVPASNTVGAVMRSWYEYGPFRTPASGALTVHAVYRGSTAVPPAEYTLASPLAGLTTIRFTAPQRDTNGEPAPISATVSSSEFRRNPAHIKRFLLSDPLDGAGVLVDPVSFGDAATVLHDAGITVEGGLSSQRSAVDVMNDLTFRGEVLGVNDLGQYTDQADSAALHTLRPPALGAADGHWENVTLQPASFRLLDQIKQLTIKAFLVPDFGGAETYTVTATRTGVAAGSTITDEEPYLSPESVDREAYYRFTRNTTAALYRAAVTATDLELRDLTLNDLVTLYCPVDPDLNGRVMQIMQRTLSADALSFRLRGYDPATYAYVSQPVQLAQVPPLIDYRYTYPPTPTNFVIASTTSLIGNDGTSITYVTLRADAPPVNVDALHFRAIPVGSVLFTQNAVPVVPGRTGVTATLAVTPGINYHYECYAYHSTNAPEYRYGIPAQMLNQLAPGDTTVPAIPTSVSVQQDGAKAVQITVAATLPPDWGTTYLYRNTVADGASAVAIDQGKKSTFHDQNIIYDTTYYYWARIADTTGNISALSPISNSILIQRLKTNDYDDDSVTTPKVPDNTVTTPKRQPMNSQAANTGTLNPNSGSAPVVFQSSALTITHNMAKTATAIPATSNALIGVWCYSNQPNTLSVAGFNFGASPQVATITIYYW